MSFFLSVGTNENPPDPHHQLPKQHALQKKVARTSLVHLQHFGLAPLTVSVFVIVHAQAALLSAWTLAQWSVSSSLLVLFPSARG